MANTFGFPWFLCRAAPLGTTALTAVAVAVVRNQTSSGPPASPLGGNNIKTQDSQDSAQFPLLCWFSGLFSNDGTIHLFTESRNLELSRDCPQPLTSHCNKPVHTVDSS